MAKDKLFGLIKTFGLAILAGICISIGCVAYLSSGNAMVGALFFAVGLFVILFFGFNLFTGKLCYTFDNDRHYALNLATILLGNFVGTNIMGLSLRLTRLSSLVEKCTKIVDVKLGDSLISLFILAILCNMLIYVAVEGFKSENNVIKFLGLMFGVSVFVLCGFEHCVADMFYFSFALCYTPKMFLCLLVVVCGNFVGGSLLHLIRKALNKK